MCEESTWKYKHIKHESYIEMLLLRSTYRLHPHFFSAIGNELLTECILNLRMVVARLVGAKCIGIGSFSITATRP